VAQPEAGAGVRCRSCFSADARPWHERHGYRLWLCRDCGCGFVAERDVPAGADALYSAAYFEGRAGTGYPSYLRDEPVMRRNFEWRLRWLERFATRGRLLDVGAAYGHCLAVARARGWRAEGIEIAADVARAGSELAGVPIHAGDFLELDVEPGFDLVTFFDVLEHMRDPAACLARARELLAPGGFVAVETGDHASPWARLMGARWHFLDPPQHLTYFSAASLAALLRRCGFPSEPRRVLPSKWLSLDNIVFKLSVLAPGRPLRALAGRLARRHVPGSIRGNIGDNMLVAAARD
jgi:SAM-dependent methyltransferase